MTVNVFYLTLKVTLVPLQDYNRF